MTKSTIAALATPMSPSGIGIVRISGRESMQVIRRIYRSKKGKKKIEKASSHTIHYGYIYDEDEEVDEVLVMIMRAPKTYTGEDTVEIDCHGGLYAMQRVLETVLKNGARIAEPGEFTKRAFLNGRLDLSQAEAVMDVIQAKNAYALRNSIKQLKGSVRQTIQEIRSRLLHHMAYIESALDDPEHISLDGYGSDLDTSLKEEIGHIQKLLSSTSEGKMLQEGISTVILGKPNAGKSSLLNTLVGEERAIVTDVAGTTRDVLEEFIHFHGISLKLIDTAGIRFTKDVVEQIGVTRAKEKAKEADLILYVVDASLPLDENDRQIIELLEEKQAIVLLNKTDLKQTLMEEDLQAQVSYPVIAISAKERTGMENLAAQIKKMFFHGELSFQDELFITNARHKEALQEALQSLYLVEESISMHMPEDFFSIDLMNAYEALGKILGESVGEDLVNEIFVKFCLGK